MRQSDIPKGANVLGGRFIITLKNYQKPQEMEKVCYVDQGLRDCDKPYMVHDVSTMRICSIRTVV